LKPEVHVPLNELSFVGAAADEADATSLLRGLASTLREIRSQVNAVVRVPRDIGSVEIAPTLSLHGWLGSRGVDRDLQRSLRSTLTQGPFCEDVIPDLEHDESIDVRCAARSGVGLRQACLSQGVVASLEHGPWRNDPLAVSVERLNAAAQVESRVLELVNFHSPTIVTQRKRWFQDLIDAFINGRLGTGKKIVENLATDLPALVLTDKARDQLEALDGTELEFSSIRRHLQVLNAHFHAWPVGQTFVAELSLPCSLESQATLNLYGDERTVKLADGKDYMFSWHSKLTSMWRIYFEVLGEPRKVVIGLVTPHLRTKMFG